MSKKHQIFISDITIFELSAKGAKYAASGLISPERISRGIRALIYSETIKILPIHESRILHIAFKLRNILSDFIDCLILSSAINNCDALITEDNDIQNIKENKNLKEIAAIKNPKFQVLKLTEIL
jgi:PIN domain nuclease of toxin-antitoxin system